MKLGNRVYTILCDDVRNEVGNKRSIIGLYRGNMIFQSVPAVLPQINLCVLIDGQKIIIPEGEVELRMPEMNPIKISLPAPPNQKIGGDTVLQIVISPFRVKSTGEAKFYFRLEGDKRATITHRFNIGVSEAVG